MNDRASITELRALLRQFARSGQRDCHVRSGGWSLFMARPGGAPNPMLAAPALQPEAAMPEAVEPVRAPHLGLFEPRCAAGDAVAVGEIIGAIDVLGRKTEVASERAGRVMALCAGAGDLVEYHDVLVEIA